MAEFRVGDTARIESLSSAMHGFEIGQKVRIKGRGIVPDYRIESLDGMSIGYAHSYNLQPVNSVLEKGMEELNRKLMEIESKLDRLLDQENAKSPNEARKEAIEKAQEFIEEVTKKADADDLNEIGNDIYRNFCTIPEFIVNEEKRTIVVLAKGAVDGTILSRGKSKCAPEDVFNADIGKAIALGRAYGLDTEEFENAPQPDEVVPGMVVEDKLNGALFTVKKLQDNPEPNRFPGQAFKVVEGYGWLADSQVRIISDTEAEY